jgi:tRNA (guanine-N7-)-methyltransferase
MTSSQRRALEDLWPVYGLEFAPQRLDLAEVFGRTAPCVLEVGFGNGDSLVQLAYEQPAANFLGIEVHDPGVGHCMLAAQAAGVANLRLIAHDALEVMQTQIAPAALARINLYFPDPWPKKRHHKRRIVQTEFIELCADRLAPRGALHIATDWADYAEHIDSIFAAAAFFACAERREHSGAEPLDRPATKFERRGERLGHRIWDWRFEKIDL